MSGEHDRNELLRLAEIAEGLRTVCSDPKGIDEISETLRALAERPVEPDLPSVEALAAELRSQVGDTTRTGQEVEACRALDAIKALRQSAAALAERPAEPDPDPDLVAAFMAEPCAYDMWGEWNPPSREEATRMAAVAQARIDAAVNAERDRIREGLEGLCRSDWHRAWSSVAPRAIAVVDEGARR